MIPHIRSLLLYPVKCRKLPPKSLLFNAESPAAGPSLSRGGELAELSSDERCDASTGLRRDLCVFRLRKHPNQWLGARRAHQNAAPAAPSSVEPLPPAQ